jgi:predicted N-acetyltransferase YhbS
MCPFFFYTDAVDNPAKAGQWRPRIARMEDVRALEKLIPLSVRSLQKAHYSPALMDAAIGPIFGVDRQLIRDGTYFIVEDAGQIVGCGGWSRRKTLYGSDTSGVRENALLDPKADAARVRAFFVHPAWARRGIARAIMQACERAIIEAGFHNVEISATLTGELLYASFGYKTVAHYDIPMAGGLNLPVVKMTKNLGENIRE